MDIERVFTQRRPSGERITPVVGVRRIAAVFSIIGFPLVVWLIDGADFRPWIETTAGGVVYGVVVSAVVVFWLISLYAVNEFRRRLALAPDRELDERELALRNASYVVAYRVSHLLLIAVTVAAVVLFSTAHVEAISRDGFIATVASFGVIVAILPGAVVAWRDRDADDPVEGAYDSARG